MHWRAQCHAKWRGRVQNSSGIKPMSPNSLQPALSTEPLVWYHLPKKNSILLVVFRHLKLVFLHTGLLYWDLSSWISWPDTNTRILERKPLIDTSYCILHRLEFKYFHLAQFFVQCSLSSSSTLRKWELRTWNLGQIFEIDLWMVGHLHSRWMFAKEDCSKNLQFENWSLSCQRLSLHGFQT